MSGIRPDLCRERDSYISRSPPIQLDLFCVQTRQGTVQTSTCDDFCHSEGTDEDKQLLDLSRSQEEILLVLSLYHVSSPFGMLCVCVCGQARYKSKAKNLLKSGCNELHRPDILTALYQSTLSSKVKSQHNDSDPCPQTSQKKTRRHMLE